MPATTTVPAHGPHTITPPSRGSLVHYHHVGDYVNAVDFPDYGIRSTSCGRRPRSTWAIASVSTQAALDTVTCPVCLFWADHHAKNC